ncbi:MAG: hypothetical protein HY034_03290 [Nitrospirae bacterium]|nr:hypothetical protein [Nitrospirota bacterium]
MKSNDDWVYERLDEIDRFEEFINETVAVINQKASMRQLSRAPKGHRS